MWDWTSTRTCSIKQKIGAAICPKSGLCPGIYPVVRSKEELYYFTLFIRHFGSGRTAETVGQWAYM